MTVPVWCAALTFTTWRAEHPDAICPAAAEAVVGHLAAAEAAAEHSAAAEAAVAHLAAVEAAVEHLAEAQASLRAAVEGCSGRASDRAEAPSQGEATPEHPRLPRARAALVRDGAVPRVFDRLTGLGYGFPGRLFDFSG